MILKPIQFIYTCYLWFMVFLAFLIHFLITRTISPFLKEKEAFYRKWAVRNLHIGGYLAGVRVSIKGLEHLPNDRNFFIAANHQSMLDIVALMISLPRPFSFFAKIELLKVPILSTNMVMTGQFFVDRRNPKRAMKQMAELGKEVENGRNVLIFPEGTRSKTGKLGPFKRGVFVLASQTGTPIIPCFINGSGALMKKGHFLAKPGKITVSLGPKIEVPQTDSKNMKEQTISLNNKVTEEVTNLMEKETVIYY